ncbi:MAG: 4-phosphoerythronate dehydrogenase [Muribaculaceae bacterium]|nr:4-phosphoerythronate dehydrogenase [Muribaculaceae bacterium]
MKIVIDEGIPYIKGRISEEAEITYLPGDKISRDILQDADCVIVRTRTKCNRSLLEGTGVKLVVTATIGKDHIEEEWCESNGIIVRNSPGCNAGGVAQYVYSSLFNLGFNPLKDNLGVIGYGHVGGKVVEWSRILGVTTLINDEPRRESGKEDVEYLPIEEVLKSSDAVTLHVPLTKAGAHPTHYLIGEKELSQMKPGSIIINSSRGGVIEEKALKGFLQDGRLKGVVDVWEGEPKIDLDLLKLSHIGTPHIAGYSEEGKRRATFMALEAVEDVLGIKTDRRGLESEADPQRILSREIIESSYDPVKDSERLKGNPSDFERIRNEYKYRHEPLYI